MGEVGLDDLLLPDIVPGSATTPILFFEEVGLHRCLVDCDCGGEKTETEDYGEADPRLCIDLEFPYHWYGDQCEQ